AHEVRRRIAAHLVPCVIEDRLEHRARRAFAVRSAYDDYGKRRHETERRLDRRDTLEPHFDRARMHALDVRKPLGQCRGEAGSGVQWKQPAASGSGAPQALAGILSSSKIRWASLSRIWRRSTIISIAPCCSRNSERWNPSGSVSRTVCSMTRGPANPMSAPGSASTTSPIIAKLADTPPIVGSVSIEMKGRRSVESWVSDAHVFAICMSERTPSCMRAPPVAVMQTNGRF